MENYPDFVKKEVFTPSKIGFSLTKLFIYILAKLGVTTVEECCSDGTQTIDEKLTTITNTIVTINNDIAPLVAPLYKEYEALLSQSGTSIPTQIIGVNTFSSVPTMGYSGVGGYTIKLTNAFTIGKTYYYISNNNDAFKLVLLHTDVDTITIATGYTWTGPSLTNGGLDNTPIRIRVYN